MLKGETEMTERIITDSNGRKHITNEPLLHPPKRQWVGLTHDEFKQIMLATYNIDLNVPGHSSDDYLLWNAIEAKLKEKNT
jgi:hypothetical protein